MLPRFEPLTTDYSEIIKDWPYYLHRGTQCFILLNMIIYASHVIDNSNLTLTEVIVSLLNTQILDCITADD